MIFSQRYFRALEDKRLTVDIPEEMRRKLLGALRKYNSSLGIQRDPNDSWISNSSVMEEVESELMSEHGWDVLPGNSHRGSTVGDELQGLLLKGPGSFVLDALELAYGWMDSHDKEPFRNKINSLFEIHACPWRLADGEFFKLDSDFVGARLTATAHDALTANHFAGAADEYARARRELAAGEAKDAIFYASKSFESVMKVLTGLEHVNADRLIKELAAQGYFDDLPESARGSLVELVMKTLPSLRNKLAGHGQGADVIEVPRLYGELAIQIAAAFHNFLIAKHLQRRPPEPPKPEPTTSFAFDDDIPF